MAGACLCNQCFNTRNGDGIAAVQWINGETFSQTIERLSDYLGVAKNQANGSRLPAKKEAKSKPAATKLSNEALDQRDLVYRELAKLFPLSTEHRKALIDRGLSESEIDQLGCWTLPKRPTLPVSLTLQSLVDATGLGRDEIGAVTPGVCHGGSSTIGHGGGALMIPSRDLQGRIQGVRVRDDSPRNGGKYKWLTSKGKKGAPNVSPGSPCHVALFDSLHDLPDDERIDELRITEGEIKADIATIKTGVLTLGVAGVNSWKKAIPIVDQLSPRKIRIALDADRKTNPAVAKAVVEIWDTFTGRGDYLVGIEAWKTNDDCEPKGIDDAILAGVRIDQLFLTDAQDHIQKLRAVAGVGEPLGDLLPYEDPHDPARLARINIARYEDSHGGKLRFWQGIWWRYKDGGWVSLSKDEFAAKVRIGIDKELTRIAEVENKSDPNGDKKKKRVSTQMVNNVVEAMKPACILPGRIAMPCWLPDPKDAREFLSLRNGLLDVSAVMGGALAEDAFVDHTPDWFSSTRIEYAFDPTATCPTWERYLETSLEQSAIAVIQEWAGYLLTSSNPYQKFMAFEGEGGTGKSVCAAALTAMLGEPNVSTAELKEFGTSFGLSATIGKSMNVDSDVQQNAKFSEGAFKKFCIGERMNFEFKGGDPFSQSPTAKVLLAWNQRPRIRDKSQGLWRRMILVPFDHVITEGEKIHGMDKPRYWERSGELPGMLNWAIDGLRRLSERGRFTVPDGMTERLRGYQLDMNPVRAFIEEVVRYEPDVKRAEATYSIVAAFKGWCAINSNQYEADAMNERRMGKAIASHFGIQSGRFKFEEISERRTRGFAGVRLLAEEEDSRDEVGASEGDDGGRKQLTFDGT